MVNASKSIFTILPKQISLQHFWQLHGLFNIPVYVCRSSFPSPCMFLTLMVGHSQCPSCGSHAAFGWLPYFSLMVHPSCYMFVTLTLKVIHKLKRKPRSRYSVCIQKMLWQFRNRGCAFPGHLLTPVQDLEQSTFKSVCTFLRIFRPRV